MLKTLLVSGFEGEYEILNNREEDSFSRYTRALFSERIASPSDQDISINEMRSLFETANANHQPFQYDLIARSIVEEMTAEDVTNNDERSVANDVEQSTIDTNNIDIKVTDILKEQNDDNSRKERELQDVLNAIPKVSELGQGGQVGITLDALTGEVTNLEIKKGQVESAINQKQEEVKNKVEKTVTNVKEAVKSILPSKDRVNNGKNQTKAIRNYINRKQNKVIEVSDLKYFVEKDQSLLLALVELQNDYMDDLGAYKRFFKDKNLANSFLDNTASCDISAITNWIGTL